MPKLALTLAMIALSACAYDGTATDGSPASVRVVPVSEVAWEQLNPARGDKSPKAGTLWGDRNGKAPTGFLFRPIDGFESPPHIHNVTYRGVVIRGVVHNDDPNAGELWMPAVSFWTQPKGHVHITSARGNDTLAYIEIDEGPYLVMPVAEAFEDAAKPINVHASNIVWVNQPNGARLAFLWGDPYDDRPSGTLVKLPPRFAGAIRSRGSALHAVVIAGRPAHATPGQAQARTLDPGSYFSSEGECVHNVTSDVDHETVLYIRMLGRFEVMKR